MMDMNGQEFDWLVGLLYGIGWFVALAILTGIIAAFIELYQWMRWRQTMREYYARKEINRYLQRMQNHHHQRQEKHSDAN